MPLSRSGTEPLEHYWADCNAWNCGPMLCSGIAPISLWWGRLVGIGSSICFIASPSNYCSCIRGRSNWRRSCTCRTGRWSDRWRFWFQRAGGGVACNFCRGGRCVWMRRGCEWSGICLLPISTSICCLSSRWLRWLSPKLLRKASRSRSRMILWREGPWFWADCCRAIFLWGISSRASHS